MIRGVLFDFFGTLVDYQVETSGIDYTLSHSVLQKAGFKGGCADYCRTWDTVYKSLSEASTRTRREFHMVEAAQTLFLTLNLDSKKELLLDFVDSFLSDWNQGVHYKANLPELFSALRPQVKIALISNTHFTPLVETHLRTMGILEYFDFVLTSVDFGFRKPHPSIFHEGITRMGIDAPEGLYIGDSFKDDYTGATEAGLRCLLIDPNSRYPVDPQDRILSVFDLPKKMELLPKIQTAN